MSEDKPFLTALKACTKLGSSVSEKEKAKSLVANALGKFRDAALQASAKTVAEYFATRERMRETGQESPAPFSALDKLTSGGLTQSCEFAWQQLGDEIVQCPREFLLRAAPTPAVLESAKKKVTGLPEAALSLCTEFPALAMQSAALEWVINTAKPKELIPLAALVLSTREGRPPLAPMSKLCAAFILRDKSGELVRELLKLGAGEPNRIATALRDYPKAFAHFVALLLRIANSPEGSNAIALFQSMDGASASFTPSDSAHVSAALMSLCGHLLKKNKHTPSEERVVAAIEASALRALDNSRMQTSTSVDSWLIARVSTLHGATRPESELSPYGAGLIANAMDKARQGISAGLLLETLASNLGMESFGTAGSTAVFNFTEYEDTVGGLLPGDDVLVVEPGWKLGDKIVRRIKVSPKSAT